MRAFVSLLFLALAATMPLGAQDAPEAPSPKTDLQRLKHTLEVIGGQAHNAGTKLRHGAASMGQLSGESARTPARMCCATNIEKIGRQFETLATSIRNLKACYRGSGNDEALVKANFVHQDAGSLHRAMGNFVEATNGEDATVGYAAVVRSLMQLQNSVKELSECP